MLKTSLATSIFAISLSAAPILSNAQSITDISGLTGVLSSTLGGSGVDMVLPSLVTNVSSTTEMMGLNSSPLFNALPNNPLTTGYSLILNGPEQTIIIGDLLQGNLIIPGLLNGLPVANALLPTLGDLKSMLPDTPAAGLIDSQL
ncbi:hypothetical protein HNQ57_002264 [Zhongshania antarctica]|uniref:Uncharacterized protein n=1 Tax=Zhongshania antarctica TaxID=641702 RepID=A0A840R4A5_9GAMM|nr:hypothetical protein [Zhongshania antarctica]MBB5187985.1 hypothetical protein [Zhongshania antarctica]